MLAALNTLSHIQTPITCRIACSQSFKPFKLTRTSNAASMVILVILVIWVGCFDNECFIQGFSRLQRFERRVTWMPLLKRCPATMASPKLGSTIPVSLSAPHRNRRNRRNRRSTQNAARLFSILDSLDKTRL